MRGSACLVGFLAFARADINGYGSLILIDERLTARATSSRPFLTFQAAHAAVMGSPFRNQKSRYQLTLSSDYVATTYMANAPDVTDLHLGTRDIADWKQLFDKDGLIYPLAASSIEAITTIYDPSVPIEERKRLFNSFFPVIAAQTHVLVAQNKTTREFYTDHTLGFTIPTGPSTSLRHWDSARMQEWAKVLSLFTETFLTEFGTLQEQLANEGIDSEEAAATIHRLNEAAWTIAAEIYGELNTLEMILRAIWQRLSQSAAEGLQYCYLSIEDIFLTGYKWQLPWQEELLPKWIKLQKRGHFSALHDPGTVMSGFSAHMAETWLVAPSLLESDEPRRFLSLISYPILWRDHKFDTSDIVFTTWSLGKISKNMTACLEPHMLSPDVVNFAEIIDMTMRPRVTEIDRIMQELEKPLQSLIDAMDEPLDGIWKELYTVLHIGKSMLDRMEVTPILGKMIEMSNLAQNTLSLCAKEAPVPFASHFLDNKGTETSFVGSRWWGRVVPSDANCFMRHRHRVVEEGVRLSNKTTPQEAIAEFYDHIRSITRGTDQISESVAKLRKWRKELHYN